MDADPPEYNPEATWEQAGLYTALRAFQENLPQVKKEANAQYGKYADLAPVTRAIVPELAKHGLVWLCKTKRKKGELRLRYKLVHAPTGQMEKGWWPLHSGNAQAQGSDMSYGRRYCLLAVTGVAPEGDDDDGQAASKDKTQQQQQPQQRQPRRGARAASDQPINENGKRPPTTANLIAMHFKRLGIEDDEERHNWVARMAGRTELASTANLPQPLQERILDAVSRARDIGKVQAWIDDQVTAS